MHQYRAFEIQARQEEIHVVAAVGVGPERLVDIKLDRPVLVVAHGEPVIRYRAARLEGALGEGFGACDDIGTGEFLRAGGGTGSGRHRHERQSRCGLKEGTTADCAHRLRLHGWDLNQAAP